MSYGQTWRGRGNDASWFVDGLPKSGGTVLTIGVML